jgi:hypothetical protein
MRCGPFVNAATTTGLFCLCTQPNAALHIDAEKTKSNVLMKTTAVVIPLPSSKGNQPSSTNGEMHGP